MQNQDKLFDKLLTEYISQSISSEDKEILFSMILDSEEFRKKYEEVARINALLHVPKFALNKEEDYISFKARTEGISGNRKKDNKNQWYHLFIKTAVAAIVLIVVSIGSVFVYKMTEEVNYMTTMVEVSTPLGGVTRLTLPDGSVAWLNSKSIVEYSSGFGSLDRKLFLSGEGYFEVMKNKELPFSVQSGDIEVVATGTIFNVRSYPDDPFSEVQLVEGGVDLLVSDAKYALKVDEKAVYNKENKTVVMEQADSYRVTQWTKGKISFNQASMPEIYKMLERHFNVKIHIDSEVLKEEYFFGSINLDQDLSQILKNLDMDRKYKIEVKDNILYIRDKR